MDNIIRVEGVDSFEMMRKNDSSRRVRRLFVLSVTSKAVCLKFWSDEEMEPSIIMYS